MLLDWFQKLFFECAMLLRYERWQQNAVYISHTTVQASEATRLNGPALRCLHVFRERYDPLLLNYTW